jgi:hypothetical protein
MIRKLVGGVVVEPEHVGRLMNMQCITSETRYIIFTQLRAMIEYEIVLAIQIAKFNKTGHQANNN